MADPRLDISGLRDPDSPYFVVGKTDTRILDDCRQESGVFLRQRALRCSGAIDPELLDRLASAISNVHFVSNPVKGLGHRWIEQPSRVGAAIELALNRPALLNWFETVTGCGPAGRIEGRLVESRPGGHDHLDWHDDQIANARFGITLHLGNRQYEGGAFELRDSATQTVIFSCANPNPGDLVIFEVNPRSQHRVLPVSSGQPRLVFTGWFIAVQNAD